MPTSAASWPGTVLVIDALAAQFGGTAYAVVQMTQALVRRDDVARVVVVAGRGSIVARGLEAHEGPRLVVVLGTRAGVIARAAWETIHLPAIVTAERADALVSCSGIVPRSPACRVISLLFNPVPFQRRNRPGSIVRRMAITRTARRAHQVYVPTREMARLVANPKAKVVPLAVDPSLFSPPAAPGDEILCVSDFYPHKRHDVILAAWSRLPEPRPTLRLIGNPAVDSDHFEWVRRMTPPGVVVDGRVGRGELVAAYRRARIFVIASELESFGMPLAEALSCGVPGVARNLPALRESGGPGAVYVDGDDPDAWAKAMRRVLDDDSLHSQLRVSGRDHVARYSWESMAAEIAADARG